MEDWNRDADEIEALMERVLFLADPHRPLQYLDAVWRYWLGWLGVKMLRWAGRDR